MTSGDRGRACTKRREPLAVRIFIAGRERVVDPVEPPVRDDEVRVGVVLEERRDQPLARQDLPVEEELALTGDLVRDEKVRVAQADREEDPVPE